MTREVMFLDVLDKYAEALEIWMATIDVYCSIEKAYEANPNQESFEAWKAAEEESIQCRDVTRKISEVLNCSFDWFYGAELRSNAHFAFENYRDYEFAKFLPELAELDALYSMTAEQREILKGIPMKMFEQIRGKCEELYKST